MLSKKEFNNFKVINEDPVDIQFYDPNIVVIPFRGSSEKIAALKIENKYFIPILEIDNPNDRKMELLDDNISVLLADYDNIKRAVKELTLNTLLTPDDFDGKFKVR